jgi:hypothetical protein
MAASAILEIQVSAIKWVVIADFRWNLAHKDRHAEFKHL